MRRLPVVSLALVVLASLGWVAYELHRLRTYRTATSRTLAARDLLVTQRAALAEVRQGAKPADIRQFLLFSAGVRPDLVRPAVVQQDELLERTFKVTFDSLGRQAAVDYARRVEERLPSLRLKVLQMAEVPGKSYRDIDQWRFVMVFSRLEEMP